eukprot:Hpha_TRINITY_DN9273_c0_g1::TRINITY_DN9273_c0_g1_i2::g.28738::m.28738
MRESAWVRDLHHAEYILGHASLAASCEAALFRHTTTCSMRRKRAQREARWAERGFPPLPLPGGELPVAFDWGTGAFSLVPAVPLTWDFLSAQFRVAWRAKYGHNNESLYRLPPIF